MRRRLVFVSRDGYLAIHERRFLCSTCRDAPSPTSFCFQVLRSTVGLARSRANSCRLFVGDRNRGIIGTISFYSVLLNVWLDASQ